MFPFSRCGQNPYFRNVLVDMWHSIWGWRGEAIYFEAILGTRTQSADSQLLPRSKSAELSYHFNVAVFQLRSLVANQIFYYVIFQFQAFPQLGSQEVYFPKFSIIVWLTICLDGLTYWTLSWAPTYMWPKDTIQPLADGTSGTGKTQKSQPRWTPPPRDPWEWPLQNCWCFFSIC